MHQSIFPWQYTSGRSKLTTGLLHHPTEVGIKFNFFQASMVRVFADCNTPAALRPGQDLQAPVAPSAQGVKQLHPIPQIVYAKVTPCQLL